MRLDVSDMKMEILQKVGGVGEKAARVHIKSTRVYINASV